MKYISTLIRELTNLKIQNVVICLSDVSVVIKVLRIYTRGCYIICNAHCDKYLLSSRAWFFKETVHVHVVSHSEDNLLKKMTLFTHLKRHFNVM